MSLMKLDKNLYRNILDGKIDNKAYNKTHQDRFIYIVNTALKTFKTSKENKLLDFGSHIGSLSLLFKHYDFDVTAIDIEEVIKNHTDNYSNNGIKYDSLDIDWERLPYEDNYFDCVIFSEVLEHLYESPIKILNELHRVLKPGGSLFLTTPNVIKLENKIKFFLNINIYQDLYRYCFNPRFGLHFREYTKKDLLILLRDYIKFAELDFRYFDYVGGRTKVNRILQRILYVITKVLYFYRGSIMAIAKK